MNLIEKTNVNNKCDDDENELDDSMSNSNNPLVIDEEAVEISELPNNDTPAKDNDSSKKNSPTREQLSDVTDASKNVIIQPVTTSTNGSSFLFHPHW